MCALVTGVQTCALPICPHRPRLLIGFAAETDHVIDHATAKRAKKDADWIVANDVSGDVMGGAANTVHNIRAQGVESWEELPKSQFPTRLATRTPDTRQETSCTRSSSRPASSPPAPAPPPP